MTTDKSVLVTVTVTSASTNKVMASAVMSLHDLREDLVGAALRCAPDVPKHIMNFSDDLEAASAIAHGQPVSQHLLR